MNSENIQCPTCSDLVLAEYYDEHRRLCLWQETNQLLERIASALERLHPYSER